MIVSKHKIIIFISFFIIISCGKDVKIEESYQILNLLMGDFEKTSILHPSFAPPPSGSYSYSKNDSLEKYMHFYKEYIKKKRIVVNNEFFEINRAKLEKLKGCKNFYSIDELDFSNNLKVIELEYLNSTESNILKKSVNQHQKIDAQLSFSNIIFNKNTDKAVVLFSVKYSKLNSFTSIIYLEKKHYLWKIVCEKNLTIS